MKKSIIVILSFLLWACNGPQSKVVIGSKNFSEQILLGEILAQLLESNGIPVQRKLNLGGTFICHQALTSGDLDLYVEYTGTAYTAVLKREPKNNAEEVYAEAKEAYLNQFQVEFMKPLGFNNTFAIIIRGEDARQLGLRTISQAAQYAPKWKAGFGYEFMERKDGYRGLAAMYLLTFAQPPKTMDLSLSYRAVAEKRVDLIAGNSTDGLIQKFDLYALQDDKHYFPPYHAAPVVRVKTLERYPQLRNLLNRLAGTITDEQMRQMNYRVDAERYDVRQVASDFLRSLH